MFLGADLKEFEEAIRCQEIARKLAELITTPSH
jgi:hypothetical protein